MYITILVSIFSCFLVTLFITFVCVCVCVCVSRAHVHMQGTSRYVIQLEGNK